MYRYICEHCGASLDPGEKCDCQDKKQQYLLNFICASDKQYEFNFDTKNTENCKNSFK